MFERFTQKAREVVTAAETHARDTTSSQVRPEHLLMALLDREDCLAVRVLDGLGAPAESLRDQLARHRSRYVDGLDDEAAEALRLIGIDLDDVVRRVDHHLGGFPPPRGRLRISRGGRKALQLALREAVALRHNYIGTEHLLLGLARCDDRVVADTMDACGLDRRTLRAAVAQAVRRAG